jgi:hypothetical protein
MLSEPHSFPCEDSQSVEGHGVPVRDESQSQVVLSANLKFFLGYCFYYFSNLSFFTLSERNIDY